MLDDIGNVTLRDTGLREREAADGFGRQSLAL
jgi:hypothetical protein